MDSLRTFLRGLETNIRSPNDDDPILRCPSEALELLKSNPEEALRYADKEIHVWPFCNVEMRWRRLYEDASILLASSCIIANAYRSEDGDLYMCDILGDRTECPNPLQGPVVRGSHKGLQDENWVTETIKLLDMAIIMTLGPQRYHEIRELFEHLENHLRHGWADNKYYRYRDLKIYQPENDERVVPGGIGRPCGEFSDDSLNHREAKVLNHPGFDHLPSVDKQSGNPQKPYVLRRAIDHWPALSDSSRCWAKPSYLLQQTFGGRRLVPIELGRAYTDEDWGQKIMPFAEFLERWVIGSNEDTKKCTVDTLQNYSIAYLAQHDLLHQIPALRNDIAIPDEVWNYIDSEFTQTPDEVSNKGTVDVNSKMTEPLINTWFGPAGTITPLHTDQYDNILCQVVGKKYIRLYAPKETPRMFPKGKEVHEVQKPNGDSHEAEVDMSNTSSIPVDVVELGAAAVVEEIDEDIADDEDYPTSKFEEFEKAEYFDLVLDKGEALVIPRGWWHYVRSLTTSISVSFWWK